MDNKKVDILGSKWNIIHTDEKNYDADAECDYTNKTITIWQGNFDMYTYAKPMEHYNRILRHELLHAYLFECGCGNEITSNVNNHDEFIIDWFARMWPRIKKTYKQLNIG